MTSGGPSILSSMLIIGGLLVAAIGVALAITSARRREKQRERERSAQRADAVHEGARTRHEGGA